MKKKALTTLKEEDIEDEEIGIQRHLKKFSNVELSLLPKTQ